MVGLPAPESVECHDTRDLADRSNNAINAGTWYWEAGSNHGLPHERSTINVPADVGVTETQIQRATRAIHGGDNGLENRTYHT